MFDTIKMKNRFIYCIILLVSLFSCQRETMPDESNVKLPESITATVGDVVNPYGTWKKGDVVTVYADAGSDTYVYDSSTKAFFSNSLNNTLSISDSYYAVFPVSKASMVSPGKFDLVFRSTVAYIKVGYEVVSPEQTWPAKPSVQMVYDIENSEKNTRYYLYCVSNGLPVAAVTLHYEP